MQWVLQGSCNGTSSVIYISDNALLESFVFCHFLSCVAYKNCQRCKLHHNIMQMGEREHIAEQMLDYLVYWSSIRLPAILQFNDLSQKALSYSSAGYYNNYHPSLTFFFSKTKFFPLSLTCAGKLWV